jgi:hypothetical protein
MLEIGVGRLANPDYNLLDSVNIKIA